MYVLRYYVYQSSLLHKKCLPRNQWLVGFISFLYPFCLSICWKKMVSKFNFKIHTYPPSPAPNTSLYINQPNSEQIFHHFEKLFPPPPPRQNRLNVTRKLLSTLRKRRRLVRCETGIKKFPSGISRCVTLR